MVEKKSIKSWKGIGQAKKNLLSLFDEILEHPGFGEIRVEVKQIKRGHKEVVFTCGKDYRFVLKPGEERGGLPIAENKG